MKKIEKSYTESMLLNGYSYTMAGGLMYVSVLAGGEEVQWDYRHDTGDGYAPVCDRKGATMVYVEDCDSDEAVIALDKGCNEHPALARLAKDHAKEMRRIAKESGFEADASENGWEAIPSWM